MNCITTLVTFVVALSTVYGREININIQALADAEQRGVIDSIVNSTIESYRKQLAEHDPLSLTDLSHDISGLGDISISDLTAQDFSDFAFTSLSVSVLNSRLRGVVRFPAVSASLTTLKLNSELANLQVALDALNAAVSGITSDIDTRFNLNGPQLTSLSLLIKIEAVSGKISGTVNDVAVDLDLDSLSDVIVTVANTLLSEYKDEISSAVLTVINGILSQS